MSDFETLFLTSALIRFSGSSKRNRQIENPLGTEVREGESEDEDRGQGSRQAGLGTESPSG